MRSRAIKCICGQGLGFFFKSSKFIKGANMGKKSKAYSILCSAVKKTIEEGYQLSDFYDHFRWAIQDNIEDGYIFEDYLNHAPEIEDEYEMQHTPEQWEQILKKAFQHRGLEYEKLKQKQMELNCLIGEGIQEVLENKDIVVNVTMEDIMAKALAKLDSKENSENMV